MVRSSFTFLILNFWLLIASDAFSYPTPVDFSGKILRWNIDSSSPAITWAVEADQQNSLPIFNQIVSNSALKWSEVSGSYLRLAKAGASEAPMITVEYRDSIAGGDSAAGYAEFDSADSDGPLHCRIHIAAPLDEDWSSLPKTTLHELGHCLGLGHSLVPESVMSYALEENSFALSLDDEAAITRLYPKNQSQSRLPPGCSIRAEHSAVSLIFSICLVILPIFSSMLHRLYTFALAISPQRKYVPPRRGLK